MFDIAEAHSRLEKTKHHDSYVKRGIRQYAHEILEKYSVLPKPENYMEPETWAEFEKALMLGAKSWKEYSDSGRALYDVAEIRKRTCPPWAKESGSPYKLSKQTWFDKQTWALQLAADLIQYAIA